jgi:orotate phosphoribosyltransferase
VYDKQALVALTKAKALKVGEFTLTSGKKGSYYLDGKQITLDPAGAVLIAEGILELLGQPPPKLVGGMAIGADPITAAVVTMAGIRGLKIKGILIRKEPKQHGMRQSIEGPAHPGDDVVIVEDVATTGGSSLAAIERAEEFGLKVKGVVAIVDRLEGAAQAFAARGYKFASLLTVRDLGVEPEK